jgi:hypothetical protein
MGELVAIGHANVGEAVGQQQDAVDPLGRQVDRDLLAAAEPAVGEVRAAAGVDARQAVDGVAPRDADADVDSTTTSIWSSYTTTLKRSRSSSRASASSPARLARSSLARPTSSPSGRGRRRG